MHTLRFEKRPSRAMITLATIVSSATQPWTRTMPGWPRSPLYPGDLMRLPSSAIVYRLTSQLPYQTDGFRGAIPDIPLVVALPRSDSPKRPDGSWADALPSGTRIGQACPAYFAVFPAAPMAYD
ncbi:MAG TPA: hypothetical protein VNZ55_02290 [Thermomicrobiales bacterium]|nr:hypothetical protein [Thermomicrobiales bacterium]